MKLDKIDDMMFTVLLRCIYECDLHSACCCYYFSLEMLKCKNLLDKFKTGFRFHKQQRVNWYLFDIP